MHFPYKLGRPVGRLFGNVWRFALSRLRLFGIVSAVIVFLIVIFRYRTPVWRGMQWLATAASQPVLQAMQKNPTLAHFVHILFDAIPDIAFSLLAVAGLSYLMPEIATKLEAKRGVRYFLLTLFGLFGFLAIWVNAVNRANQEQTDTTQRDVQGKVLNSVIDIQTSLHSTKTLSESDRRQKMSESLRDEYILTHNPIDPAIIAGKAMPPQEWMNKRLSEMGETWSVAEATPRMAVPRSYIVLDGNPKFTGPNAAGIEGNAFVAGSPIAFNIHYKNTGPNVLELEDEWRAAYLRDDFTPETQDAMLAEFTNAVKKEKRAFGSEKLPPRTMFIQWEPEQANSSQRLVSRTS